MTEVQSPNAESRAKIQQIAEQKQYSTIFQNLIESEVRQVVWKTELMAMTDR
jgi:hypothetical protein